VSISHKRKLCLALAAKAADALLAETSGREFTARIRCFCEPLQTRRIRLDSEGYARVYDQIARHYVVTALTPGQRRRLARLAKDRS